MTTQADREKEAAHWLIEQDDLSSSAGDRTAFGTWFSASVENRLTYLALERAWHRTLALRRIVRPTGWALNS